MASSYKFQTSNSGIKVYSTYENAEKAFSKLFGDIDLKWMVIQLSEKNSTNPKHYGKFIPVAIGINWVNETNVHFHFNVVG